MAMEGTKLGRIKLGSEGLEVSAQGLGCMGMSAFYGPPKPEPEMIELIHHAINSGVTLLDTSDVYGPHTNEILIGKALKGGMREQVVIATKFGIVLGDEKKAEGKREVHGDPVYVRSACEASLKRLDVDCIDLYYQHRIDTRVPIEVTVGELKKLVEEGKIKYIGLSEASASTIRRAHAVHPITAVQLEWSLWSRDVEEEIIPTCRELGIGIVAYSPLGRGFLSSGPKLLEEMSNEDYRKASRHRRTAPSLQLGDFQLPRSNLSSFIVHCYLLLQWPVVTSVNFLLLLLLLHLVTPQHLPRFQADNLEHNKMLYKRICQMAAKKGCTPSQLALAWVHHQGNDVCPIPGTTKIENFNQNIGALSVKLTSEDMTELESIASANAVQGDRYIPGMSTFKNSETPPLSAWKAT